MRQVYIISDLHLGGVYGTEGGGRGFRINTRVAELTEFVLTLANKPGPERELVINGDLVDFLAEKAPSPPHFIPFTQDAQAAVEKLEAICSRDKQFFDALGTFLAAGHKLTILLGNHDIELALPAVRERLAQIIGVRPGQDYSIITNGEAIIRGDALIEHGNRYDEFNVVDYDSLRRLASLQSRRQPVPEKYEANAPAGSYMVAEVINPIKEQYRFVDLLKPETGAVTPVLLALEPGFRGVLAKVAGIAMKARDHRMAAPAMPSFGGDISANVLTAAAGAGASASGSVGGDLGGLFPGVASLPAEPVVSGLESLSGSLGGLSDVAGGALEVGQQQIGSDISTFSPAIDRTIGMFQLLISSRSGDIEKRLPALVRALRELQSDRTADETFETEKTYIEAAEELAKGGFKYVSFGHTHARKRVPLPNGGFYLNSGCWVDLMRVPKEIWSEDEGVAMGKAREFLTAIQKSDLSGWIVYDPTFVRLDVEGERVTAAELCRYSGPASVQ